MLRRVWWNDYGGSGGFDIGTTRLAGTFGQVVRARLLQHEGVTYHGRTVMVVVQTLR